MTRLIWGEAGTRFFETGIDRGVLFPRSGPGVPWSGLISVAESSAGGESKSYYAEGVKFLELVLGEDFQATLEAFSAPPEFAACDGLIVLAAGLFATRQPRASFDLSYRSLIGSDLDPDAGYKIHLVYNGLARPSTKTRKTQSKDPDPTTQQWEINTVPPSATTHKPTAHLVVDSTQADATYLSVLEDMLYGSDDGESAMPSPDEVVSVLTTGHI